MKNVIARNAVTKQTQNHLVRYDPRASIRPGRFGPFIRSHRGFTPTLCHKGQFQLDFPSLCAHESRVLLTTPFTPLIEGDRSGLPHLRRVLCPLLTSAWRSGNLKIASVPISGHHADLPRGKFDNLHRTPAEFTALDFDGYGLCCL